MIRTAILPTSRRISLKRQRRMKLRNRHQIPINRNAILIRRIRRRCPWEAAATRFLSAKSTSTIDEQSNTTKKKSTISTISIEEQYSRKTPLEHVLLRPGMYVGAVERQSSHLHWMWNDETQTMMPPSGEIVPALIKLLDEILVNASDNHFRHPTLCTQMDVMITATDDNGIVCSVYNNGPGIPVEWHPKEKLYVPELVFGHLLTGSNFGDADSSEATTGGRHGYGAKLTNIFSHEFTLDTICNGVRYQQTWQNNMHAMGPASITFTKEEDCTRVSFRPDLQRLTGKNGWTEADVSVMKRRVLDIAACLSKNNFTVTLNGANVTPTSFQDYCLYYTNAADGVRLISTTLGKLSWEVVVGLCPPKQQQQVISFVNGIHTLRGGTHVQWMMQQIVKLVLDNIHKNHPDLKVQAKHVRPFLFLGLNVCIEDPSFDSQAKESLTTSKTNNWPSLSREFEEELLLPSDEGGLGLIETVVTAAQHRQEAETLEKFSLEKTKTKQQRQLQGIAKLEDAHNAGRQNTSCTLILTEGDSAKALAVAGLEVIGRANFGVFPLRGKFLNVKHASMEQMAQNPEIKALLLILGLELGKKYIDRSSLRYQHVLLMTDQDTDGSHIKGLVMNFFHEFWPELLDSTNEEEEEEQRNKQSLSSFRMPPNFLSCFVTPLLKATPKNKKEEVLSFYSMAEYQAWEQQQQQQNRYTLKYYKGLGTSTPAEAKEYFEQFQKHIVPFHWKNEDDGKLLDMVFDKERAPDRREWILQNATNTNNDGDSEIATMDGDDDPNEEEEEEADNGMTYQDFFNKEFIHFSNADNIRSLPNVIDGLKPSQRKVLYACFHKKLHKNSEIKVAQLTGYCAEQTAYHHGEMSLQSTIVGMAQDFVGSNNMNLLVPQGQFGTRLQGGTDAASARYIFTKLAPVTRLLFPAEDEALLDYIQEEGQSLEPLYYCPIIPFLLVNGAQGIGTGWSTYIPPHNPLDLVKYIRAKLVGEDNSKLEPWIRGFYGTINPNETKGFITRGKIRRTNQTTLEITELPVNKWTNDYKTQVLLKLQDKGDITSFIESHTTTTVKFTISCKAAQIDKYENQKGGWENKFKLSSKLTTTNMNAFEPVRVPNDDQDHRGDDNNNYLMKIKKYQSAEDIINQGYFPIRHSLYQDRHSVLQSELAYTSAVASNKARFIQDVIDQKVDLLRRSQQDTLALLIEQDYADLSTLQAIRQDNALLRRRHSNIADIDLTTNNTDDDGGGTDQEGMTSKDFDYLLSMPLSFLTEEKANDLHRAAEKNKLDLQDLQQTTPEDLWMNDLDKLEAHLKNGGDYIKENSSPFEAAAQSGLEAGERVASLFQQTDESQP